MNSFFDNNYQTPAFIKKRISRRGFLKSAAMTSVATALPLSALTEAKVPLADLKTEPWQSLNAVLEHLLPTSETGPGAAEIQAIHYLYNVMTQQPTEPSEKEFIEKGVGWLNGYTKSNFDKPFSALSTTEKERALRAIANSTAGENWLSTLISYIFEAMLSPPSYGGNPDGIGWTWLQHKPGFPLPPEGKRYYELPAYAAIKVKNIDSNPKQKPIPPGKA